MSGSAKRKSGLWFGYLDAGDKSTAVLRDDRLDTGNRKTMFLFNLARGALVEYTREIVEPKLRELKPTETKLADELDAAYAEARRAIKAQTRALNIPEKAAPPRKEADTRNSEVEFDGFMDSDDEDGAWIDSPEEEES